MKIDSGHIFEDKSCIPFSSVFFAISVTMIQLNDLHRMSIYPPPHPLSNYKKKNKNKNFLTFDINIYFVRVFSRPSTIPWQPLCPRCYRFL